MMSYCTVSKNKKDKVKKFAEVFTSAGVVFEMCLQEGLREVISNVDKTIFDPAVGEGQFPCAELVLKMFFNVERLDEEIALRALNSLYGMDIQQASVDKAHAHLIATLRDAFFFFTGKNFSEFESAKEIVADHITCGDSLAYMKKLAQEKMARNFSLSIED